MADDFAKILAILGKTKIQAMEAAAIRADYEYISENLKEKIIQFEEEISQKNQNIEKMKREIEENLLKIQKIHASPLFDKIEEQRCADELNNCKKKIEALERECNKKVDNSHSTYLESVKLFEDSLPKCKELATTKSDNKKLLFELNLLDRKIKYKEAQIKQVEEIQKKKLNNSIVALATAISEREEYARTIKEIKMYEAKIRDKNNKFNVQIGHKETENEKIAVQKAKDKNIYDFDNFEFQDINLSFDENLSSNIRTSSQSIDSIMQNVLKFKPPTADKKQCNNSNKELPISIVNKMGKTSNNLQKIVRFNKEKTPRPTLKKLEIPQKYSPISQSSKIEILQNAKLALSERSMTKLDSNLKNENQCKESEKYTTKSNALQMIKPGLQARPGFKTPEIIPKPSGIKQKLRFEDLENVKMTLSNRSPKKLESKSKKSTRFGALTEKKFYSNSTNIKNIPNEFQPSPKKQKIDLEFRTPQASPNNMFEGLNKYKSPSFEMDLNADGSPTFNFDLQTSPFRTDDNMEESINDQENFDSNEFVGKNMFN